MSMGGDDNRCHELANDFNSILRNHVGFCMRIRRDNGNFDAQTDANVKGGCYESYDCRRCYAYLEGRSDVLGITKFVNDAKATTADKRWSLRHLVCLKLRRKFGKHDVCVNTVYKFRNDNKKDNGETFCQAYTDAANDFLKITGTERHRLCVATLTKYRGMQQGRNLLTKSTKGLVK